MTGTRPALAAAALVILLPSLLPAQAASVYRHAPGDTLRYREVSEGAIELTSPQDIMPVRIFHDARMAFAFGQADTVRAWYETLSISMTGAQGDNAPDTRAALGLPFVLRIDSLGQVETLAVPTFPATFEGVADLRVQFMDYFLPLSGQRLAPGASWSDSVVHVASEPGGKRNDMRWWGEYRVAGDTVVGGRAALVIAAVVRISMHITGPAQGMTVVSELNGEERGAFYWDPRRGRLLGRTGYGDLSGTLHMTGARGTVDLPQRLRYEHRLDLVE